MKSKLCTTLIYDILKTRNSTSWQFVQKIRLWFCTCRKLSFLFIQYPMFTKSLFAHQDWNKLHNNSILINIIVLKAHGAEPRVWGYYVFFSCTNIVLMWHESDSSPQKYYINFIHKQSLTIFGEWWQKSTNKMKNIFLFLL